MKENRLFAKAVAFASFKHMNQTRRDESPYIYHPLNVARLVKEQGFSVKYQIVAVLHDVLEDTDATVDDIKKFGDDVAEAVILLTREKGMDEADYVTNILQNHMAAVVKNVDKIENLSESGFTGPKGSQRSEKHRNWAINYARKADEYYKGKFSEALDIAIDAAKVEAENPVIRNRRYNNAQDLLDRMTLYSDIQKKKKKELSRVSELPDFNRPDAKFFADEFNYVYCGYFNGWDIKKAWGLTPEGWIAIDADDDLDEVFSKGVVVDKAWVEDAISMLTEDGYFDDTTDVNTLLI